MDGAYAPNDLLDHCRQIGAPIPGADDIAEGPRRRALPLRRKPDPAPCRDRVCRALGFRHPRRRWPAASPFTPMAGCWSASPGAGWWRSHAGGQQTWLNQADDQPLQCLTDVDRHARRHHLPDRRQYPAPAGGLAARPHGKEPSRPPDLVRAGARRRQGSPAGDALSAWAGTVGRRQDPLVHRKLEPPAEPGGDHRPRPSPSRRIVVGNMPGYPARLGRARPAAVSGSVCSRCARISSNSCCARTITAKR